MSSTPITYQTIGVIHTPFKEKFGTPRQPGLIQQAQGWITFFPPYDQAEAFEGLDGFSHLWLLFDFHLTPNKNFQASVRPPRLGGNTKQGVFATRSPFRPNHIGLSVVANGGWVQKDKKLVLQVSGVDLVDQTPILDIKPYLPYCESLPQATGGFAVAAPQPSLQVKWTPEALNQLKQCELDEDFQTLASAVLSQDPRPAYQHGQDTLEGGLLLQETNLKYRVEKNQLTIFSVEKVSSN
ncbi:MAG: tRNA (N6-threonylcarbamoyladenosine(37)-N6)-methyltransferase TrmO [Myxococcales bacterium]|nr:tRNA (N6-threonylcarbamoyladenosine(37)-N6)-methyltransferase TrmO [Myxococcales bacterium]|tara:strand:- start:884 stop:1600 length:717 start_codon:yes stop_codon:yes gene_type:complete